MTVCAGRLTPQAKVLVETRTCRCRSAKRFSTLGLIRGGYQVAVLAAKPGVVHSEAVDEELLQIGVFDVEFLHGFLEHSLAVAVLAKG